MCLVELFVITDMEIVVFDHIGMIEWFRNLKLINSIQLSRIRNMHLVWVLDAFLGVWFLELSLVVNEVVITLVAKTASINLSVCVLTVLGFVLAAIHVIAVITHAFGIVFLVRMGTVGDTLDFLFGEHAVVHFLTFKKLLRMMNKITNPNWCGLAFGDRELLLPLYSNPLTWKGMILIEYRLKLDRIILLSHRYLRINLILLYSFLQIEMRTLGLLNLCGICVLLDIILNEIIRK